MVVIRVDRGLQGGERRVAGDHNPVERVVFSLLVCGIQVGLGEVKVGEVISDLAIHLLGVGRVLIPGPHPGFDVATGTRW